eukprot:3226480-Lingulodinium_polyedra.AAC.1
MPDRPRHLQPGQTSGRWPALRRKESFPPLHRRPVTRSPVQALVCTKVGVMGKRRKDKRPAEEETSNGRGRVTGKPNAPWSTGKAGGRKGSGWSGMGRWKGDGGSAASR